MIRIALVGDIGSGKTFYSKLFKYPVFNADLVVSNLYQKDKSLFRKIKKKFPNKISNFPLKKEEVLKIIFQKQKNLNILGKIIHPIVRKKMKNFLKVNKKKGKFTLFEMFNTISDELWSELNKIDEINSFRRETQSFYIDLLSNIYFDENNLFPKDTKSISFSMLRKIRSNISEALPYYVFEDETTSAHLRLMINKIDSVLDAQMMVR